MNLFGRTLGPEEIFALVGLLMVLVLWTMRLKGDREWTRWFRAWDADRKARREADEAGQPPPAERGEPRGPGAEPYSRRSSLSVRIVPHHPALNSARIALGS